MPHTITRRQFLQYSAAVLAALGLAPPLLAPAPAAAVAAAPRQAEGVAAPAFAPLPLPALLGAPVDIATGTDGVLWVLGESGAPSTYDPLQGAWQPFGGGIDAAAYIPFVDSSENFSVAVCFFRGGEVYKSGTPAPVPIASLWPKLPPSFQGGVDGATYLSDANANAFYLFRHGQAALVDIWGDVSVSLLTDFRGAGWPGGAWQDGRFDFVISGKDPAYPGYALFVRGGEFIVANLGEGLITGAPQPLSAAFGGAALALLQGGGLQAGLFGGAVPAADAPFELFGGPVVYTLENTTASTPPQAQYLAQAFGGWPETWHPILRQAPAGSSGALWSVTAGGTPVGNDASGWSPAPLSSAGAAVAALAVDCGADGSVYAVTSSALLALDAGGSWTEPATAPFVLQGVAVGDADYVWVTDDQGAVYRFAGGAFTPAALGVPAGDVAANPDGTLWHCRAGEPNAYRFVAEGQQPSEAIPIGQGVTSVQKAAATAFGSAWFLAQQNGQSALISYTSPYLFKTPASYTTGFMQRIATGAGAVFVPNISADQTQISITALDMQTGAERWRYPYAADQATAANFLEQAGAAPLYDAEHQLLYVFQYRGVIDALDAQTGEVRWSLSLAPLNITQAVIPVQPILAAGALYVAAAADPAALPGSTMLYLVAVDTGDALTRAGGGQPVAARWVSAQNVPDQSPMLPLPPVYYAGAVYQSAWSVGNPQQLQLNTWRTDPATGAANNLWYLQVGDWPRTPLPTTAPIVANLRKPPQIPDPSPALVVSTGQTIFGIFLDGAAYAPSYTTPELAQSPSYTNMLLVGGNIFFADSAGNLYGLDPTFNPLPNLPAALVDADIYAPLSATGDGDGGAVIILGNNTGGAAANLVFYDVATGNSLSLATNQTSFMSMSAVTGDGMLFGGGAGPEWSVGQFFGIRTSDLRALRDFVIESQLLQDYDPGPVAVARYQTRVTIVDDAKTPQPFTGVKIWADTALAVQIDGTAYTIGPDAPAATSVDASGTLTILSDAGDLFATPLRIWAAFMDPFERILIYPDREFHARLPGIVADPTNDDPTVINLATGTNYAGTQLFPNQQQAQTIATTVATTCQAAGIGAGGGTGAGARTGAQLPPFTAYADLPGMQYTPYNTPATRPAAPQGVYGVSWSAAAPDAYAVLSFAAAAGAIDGLEGAVDPSLPGPLRGGLGSIFSDLWHKIKRGIAKVTEVIVSIGNAVYAGIQYVEDGVTKVFRFVVREIEDLAATVGAFFLALGKAIEDIIELLSLLLHFEEVVKTHIILKAHILAQLNNLPALIQSSIMPAVQGFFATGEGAFADAFCKVKQQIVQGYSCSAPGAGAGPSISGLDGIGATPHTIFSAAPKSGGSAKSHAVAATWGFDKVRSHYKQASTAGTGASADNPVLAFAASFADSLTSNSTLQQAYAATQRDFAAAFTFKSPADFLQMALFSMLDVIQDLLVSSLAVGAALLEGILGLAEDLVTFLLDPQDGILVQPLDIPILSELYQLLFDAELTFLDLVILVASIPVTFIYRIIEGEWPAEQITAQAAQGAQVSLTPLARAAGLLNTALFCGRGVLMPINDTSASPGAPNPILSNSLAAISGCFFGTTLATAAGPSAFFFSTTALALIIIPYIGPAAPGLASIVALTRIGAFVLNMVAAPSAHALLTLSGGFLGSVPPLAQPLKYLNNATDDISELILVGLELIGNFGAALVTFINTTAPWSEEPTALPPAGEPLPDWPPRVHLPFVQGGP